MTIHQVLVSRELGGAGQIALRIASDLRRQSRPVKVWIPGEGPADRAARALGLDVVHYDPRMLSSGRTRWRTAKGNVAFFREFLRTGRGLVHVHSPFVYRSLVPALVAARMRSVVHLHLDEASEGLRWALQNPPHLILTCARYMVRQVEASLPAPCRHRPRIEAAPNAVDTQRFRPGAKLAAKRKVGAPPDLPLILMLANLAPHKGQETAIFALSILRQRGTPALLWLAGIERGGTCEYTQRLQGMIRDLGLEESTRLLGQRGDAEDLLRAADFFLLPSTNEGLPLSILEAQASGVPVLAAPTAGIPEVVEDGRSGFLIDAADAQSYAERIRLLLNDHVTYRQVAERAYQRVTHELTWDIQRERILGLYNDLLVAHPKQREPTSVLAASAGRTLRDAPAAVSSSGDSIPATPR